MKQTTIVFDSREARCKTPYGAVQAGQSLRLRVYVAETLGTLGARTVVRYDRHETPASYPMTKSPSPSPGYTAWEVTFPVYDTGLYWYHFVLDTEEGELPVHRGQEGEPVTEPGASSCWQITVYHRAYHVPEWICGGVFYHIFVDRFCPEGPRVHQPGKICREDWGGTPAWEPVDGKVLNNDFFGGNLRGIISKLPYLEDLGVTCLYLSPIFEAYSNHKYDTGDYMCIDPMFGTEEDFRELCSLAKERGMAVICDGVFAHTGADSRYFNKPGHYPDPGAWGNPDSPYRNWYEWTGEHTYKSWWGIDTLPRINTDDPDYRAFITGKGGVVRKWLQVGASGWRLDVVDEYPAAFLEMITAAAKAEKPDAMVLGEVWEDASIKSAYGERKNYFEGNKLDSVMNYPLMNAIVDFVRKGEARILEDTLQQILEHYPPEVLHCLMNILGTHDTPRILTQLAGSQLPQGTPREIEAADRMSPEDRSRGIAMLKQAVALQMTLPGVPCIYYGDEAGMEGQHDPFNRGCYPWGEEDTELQDWYRTLIAIRRSHRAYAKGDFLTLACVRGLFGFQRFDTLTPGGQGLCQRLVTAVNCGVTAEEMTLPGSWQDLLSGDTVQNTLTLLPGETILLEKTEEI